MTTIVLFITTPTISTTYHYYYYYYYYYYYCYYCYVYCINQTPYLAPRRAALGRDHREDRNAARRPCMIVVVVTATTLAGDWLVFTRGNRGG